MLELPDLHSPQKFQSWFLEQKRHKISPDSIIESLVNLGSELALLRAACVSYWSGEREDLFDLANRTLASRDPVIEGYARSLVAFQFMVQNHARGETTQFGGAVDLMPALETLLENILAQPHGPLMREAEASVRTALALANILLKEFVLSARQASEAVFWSRQIGAPISEYRARTQMISCYGNSGRIVDTIRLIYGQASSDVAMYAHHAYQQAVLSSLLSHLGNYKEARNILLCLLEAYPTPTLRAAFQRLECFWGTGGLEGQVEADVIGSAPRGWVVEALRYLLMAEGLPRLGQSQGELDRYLSRAIAVCRELPYFSGPWYESLSRWIIARVYYRQGKGLLADGQLATHQIANREMLDLRVLFAGLRLELALSPYLPDLSPARAEQELREVFADAATIPHASRTGLAQLLQRWHPVAAAYAAVMPNPIPELEFATQAILEAGERCQVYGLPMPPVYAAELILRSLGWDSRRDRGFIQSPLNKREIAQRDALTSHYGEVPYWRPVVTGMQLVFGLTKAGQGRPEYAQAAQRILHSYGLLPQSRTPYAQHELGLVHAGVQGLTSGALSAQDFARMVYQ